MQSLLEGTRLAERDKFKAALEDIARYGREKPGNGYSCATKAMLALGLPTKHKPN